MRIFFNLRPPHAHPAALACRCHFLLGRKRGRRKNMTVAQGKHEQAHRSSYRFVRNQERVLESALGISGVTSRCKQLLNPLTRFETSSKKLRWPIRVRSGLHHGGTVHIHLWPNSLAHAMPNAPIYGGRLKDLLNGAPLRTNVSVECCSEQFTISSDVVYGCYHPSNTGIITKKKIF